MTLIWSGMRTRYLEPAIEELSFADHKMAFVSGPRQCGKTTLAKRILQRRGGAYHNWDDVPFRRRWVKDPKGTLPAPVGDAPRMAVFDELHKARGWKGALKGIYDTLTVPVDILVTGSARLNVYRKGSDSLLGRYHHYRLHPFSLGELRGDTAPRPDAVLMAWKRGVPQATKAARLQVDALMRFGPFPEPLLAQDERKARLWRRNRLERVIREDLRDMSRIPELSRVEMLASLIPERVGSPISVASLRDLLEVSHPTVRRWLESLKELYYVFEVKPHITSIARSIRKEGKFYMWDSSEVPDEGPRFENLVALHLLKACHFWTDTGEGVFDLCYLRNKDGMEIDFLVTRDGRPWLPVEAKLGDAAPSPNWRRFLSALPCTLAVQVSAKSSGWNVVQIGGRSLVMAGAAEFLSELP